MDEADLTRLLFGEDDLGAAYGASDLAAAPSSSRRAARGSRRKRRAAAWNDDDEAGTHSSSSSSVDKSGGDASGVGLLVLVRVVLEGEAPVRLANLRWRGAGGQAERLVRVEELLLVREDGAADELALGSPAKDEEKVGDAEPADPEPLGLANHRSARAKAQRLPLLRLGRLARKQVEELGQRPRHEYA